MIVAALSTAFTLFIACKNQQNPYSNSYVDGTAEVGQQIADIMASVDEMGGASGTLHTMATCYGNGFGACASNNITRNFSGCTTGPYTFTGTVGFTWGGSSVNCTMGGIGAYVTRVPNYQISGYRNGLLSVYKDPFGEKLTWSSTSGGTNTYAYNNSGTRRNITVNGTLYYDTTLTTAGDVAVIGQNRANRKMSGGTIELVDNMTGMICTLSAQNVTWADATCTCATQGSWVGTCVGAGAVRLDMLACGSASITLGNYSEGIQLDRCTNM